MDSLDRDNSYDSAKFNTLTGYWCLPCGTLTDFDKQILTDLYLPLLGPSAYSLYLLLWEKTPNNKLVSERESHAILLSLLGMDLKEFYNTRIRNEALNLIRTYRKNDQLGNYYVYQLIRPCKPSTFFSDDLLSVFLYEQIGKNEYNYLVGKYSKSDDILNDSVEISKNFFDVFNIGSEYLNDIPDTIKDSRRKVNNSNKSNKKIVLSDSNLGIEPFDFDLLEQGLSKDGITHKDIDKNREEIFNLHTIYDVDEVTMMRAIESTSKLVPPEIQIDELKKHFRENFKANVHYAIKRNTSNSNINVNSSKKVDESQFSNYEKQILANAKTKTSMKFLESYGIKRGAEPTHNEINAIINVSRTYDLPAQVINILIYYYLDYLNSKINFYSFEDTAKDWKQKKILTAEDAVIQIHEFYSKKESKKAVNGRRVEKGTDWSKVKANIPETDEEYEKKQKEIQEELRKFREGGDK